MNYNEQSDRNARIDRSRLRRKVKSKRYKDRQRQREGKPTETDALNALMKGLGITPPDYHDKRGAQR